MKTYFAFKILEPKEAFEVAAEAPSTDKIIAPQCTFCYRVRKDMHYFCTRPAGHQGPHVAHGDDRRDKGILKEFAEAVWPQKVTEEKV